MVGPVWLFEKFPKVGNSNAIKLLKVQNPYITSLPVYLSTFSSVRFTICMNWTHFLLSAF